MLADAVRIREVLVNILGNAVKFTDDGGTITFEASYHPGVDAQHIVVRYRVPDTGEGSTFTVELPLELTDESKIQKQDHPVANVDLTGVKILLAEDNDLNAEIAMVQLEEQGIRVTRASDGKEAMKTFTENPPDTFDMIFMDIMMPEMNGYEVTETIRSIPDRPDAHRIPIIAMTANAFAEDVQASLDAGMNGHLSKPIVMEEVVKAIARNLNR